MAVTTCDERMRWGVWVRPATVGRTGGEEGWGASAPQPESFSPHAEAPKAPEITLMAGRCRRDQLQRVPP